jgi:hypothetical protein
MAWDLPRRGLAGILAAPIQGAARATGCAATGRRAYAKGCLAVSFWATTASTVG